MKLMMKNMKWCCVLILILFHSVVCASEKENGIYIIFPDDNDIQIVGGDIKGSEWTAKKRPCGPDKKFSFISTLKLYQKDESEIPSKKFSKPFLLDNNNNNYYVDLNKPEEFKKHILVNVSLKGNLRKYHEKKYCNLNSLQLKVSRNNVAFDGKAWLTKNNFILKINNSEETYHPVKMDITIGSGDYAEVNLVFRDEKEIEGEQNGSPQSHGQVSPYTVGPSKTDDGVPKPVEIKKIGLREPKEGFEGSVVSFLDDKKVICAQLLWDDPVNKPLDLSQLKIFGDELTTAIIHFPEGDVKVDVKDKNDISIKNLMEQKKVKCRGQGNILLFYKKDNDYYYSKKFKCSEEEVNIEYIRDTNYWTIGESSSQQNNAYYYLNSGLIYTVKTLPEAEVVLLTTNGMNKGIAKRGQINFYLSDLDILWFRGYVFKTGYEAFIHENGVSTRELIFDENRTTEIELKKIESNIKAYSYNSVRNDLPLLNMENLRLVVKDKNKVLMKAPIKYISHIPDTSTTYQFYDNTGEFLFRQHNVEMDNPLKVKPSHQKAKLKFVSKEKYDGLKIKSNSDPTNKEWKKLNLGEYFETYLTLDKESKYTICADGYQKLIENVLTEPTIPLNISLRKSMPLKLVIVPGYHDNTGNLIGEIYNIFGQIRYDFNNSNTSTVLLFSNGELIPVTSIEQFSTDIVAGDSGSFSDALAAYLKSGKVQQNKEDCEGRKTVVYYVSPSYPENLIKMAADEFLDVDFFVIDVAVDKIIAGDDETEALSAEQSNYAGLKPDKLKEYKNIKEWQSVSSRDYLIKILKDITQPKENYYY